VWFYYSISLDFGLSTYNCKIEIRPERAKLNGESHPGLPKYYKFGGREENEATLRNNMALIKQEVHAII
jgi:hypothetical protein